MDGEAIILIPAALEAAAALLGVSRTDVITRAVQAYAFLEFERSTGAEVLVRRGGVCSRVEFTMADLETAGRALVLETAG